MATDDRVVRGSRLIEQLAAVLGVDGRMTRRIVLDVDVRNPITAYVELYGTDKLLQINWAGELQDTKLVVVDKPEGSTDA